MDYEFPTLEQLAGFVRRHAEKHTDLLNVDSEDLAGACYYCSRVLAKVLNRYRRQAKLVMGVYITKDEDFAWYYADKRRPTVHDTNHCWVEVGRYYKQVVDITATQFGVRNRVWIPAKAGDICRYVPFARGPRACDIARESWMHRDDIYRDFQTIIDEALRAGSAIKRMS